MLRLEEHLELPPDERRKLAVEIGCGWKARGKRYGHGSIILGGNVDAAAAYRYIYHFFQMYIIDHR